MVLFHKKTGEGIDMKHNLSLYFNLAKKYKWLFLVIILFVLVAEGILVFERFLFKVVVDRGTEFLSGELARNVLLNGLIVIGVVFLTAVVVKSFSSWMQVSLSNSSTSPQLLPIAQKSFAYILPWY